MTERTALVIGATRGLGLELTKELSKTYKTYATSRKPSSPDTFPSEVGEVSGIDATSPNVGDKLVEGLKKLNAPSIDLLVISAGLFKKETFDEPNWDDQVEMYKIVAISPVFIVTALAKAGFLKKGGKIILVSSEAGSIKLRHEKEGGGNYGHHAGKAALNMVGKLLSLDLKEKEITVGIIHPGFMRTEMTKGVGLDSFYDEGHAVTPAEAAKSSVEFIEGFDLSKTGTYWAPRGPIDIGTAEPVLGDNLPTPLQLPW